MSEKQTESAAPAAGARKKSRSLFRSSRTPLVPRYVKILGLVALAAFAWLAAEFLAPRAGIAAPSAAETAPADEKAAAAESQQRDSSGFEIIFRARKLFIPEIAVESEDTSGLVVDELIKRLKLMGITKEGEDFSAWVQVSEVVPETPGRGYSPRAPGASGKTTVRVKKGDKVLDFKVDDVTADSVKLSVAGFNRTLGF
jgi:hypothetical protein